MIQEMQILYVHQKGTLFMLGLAVLVFALITAVSADSSDAADSHAVNETITWTYSEESKTLTISGTGDIPAYGSDSAPWKAFDIEAIVIGEGITSVGSYAFSGMPALQHVALPETLLSIGASAFRSSVSLGSVSLPDGVVTIGARAFSYCASLSTVYVGHDSKLDEIGEYAFYSSGLTEFTFPRSLHTVGDRALHGCSNLVSVTFDEGVLSLGEGCFAYTALRSVSLPDSLVSVGAHLFDHCPLEHLCIGDGITYAFDLVDDMSQIDVEYGSNYAAPVVQGTVCYIPAMCVSLPASYLTYGNTSVGMVSYMSYGSFIDTLNGLGSGTGILNRYNITEFVVDPANTIFSAHDGVLYSKDMSTLVLFPNALEMDGFNIPRGVQHLGVSCFSNTMLSSLTIPNTVVSIGDYAVNLPGGEVTVPVSVTLLGFRAIRASILNLDCSVDLLAWYNVSTDTEVMNLGKSVHGLNITVGQVYYGDTHSRSSAVALDVDKLVWPKLREINVDPENQYLSSVGGILYSGDGKRLVYVPYALEAETYDMPNSVEYIYSGSPADRSTRMPYHGTSISPGAFQYAKFTTVRLSENLLNIGNAAFYNNPYLESVKVPASVVKIGERAFERCISLSAIYFEGNIPQLDSDCLRAGWDIDHKAEVSVYSSIDSDSFLDRSGGKHTLFTYYKTESVGSDTDDTVSPWAFVVAVILAIAAYALYTRYVGRHRG